MRPVAFVAQERLEQSAAVNDGHADAEAVSAAPFDGSLNDGLSHLERERLLRDEAPLPCAEAIDHPRLTRAPESSTKRAIVT